MIELWFTCVGQGHSNTHTVFMHVIGSDWTCWSPYDIILWCFVNKHTTTDQNQLIIWKINNVQIMIESWFTCVGQGCSNTHTMFVHVIRSDWTCWSPHDIILWCFTNKYTAAHQNQHIMWKINNIQIMIELWSTCVG